MVTIEQIEDAISAELKAAVPKLTVETYSGELDDVEKIAQLVRSLPAVLLALGGSVYERRKVSNANLYFRKVHITAFVVTRDLRDKSGTAVYPLLDTIFKQLADKTLGLDIQPIEITDEEALLNKRGLSVYAVSMTTKINRGG